MRGILIGGALALMLGGGLVASGAPAPLPRIHALCLTVPIRDRSPPFWYLVGTYELSLSADATRAALARMTISAQHGDRFTIGIAEPTGNAAVDWQGQGVIKGNTGHYDWVFPDGKTGRTTITIDDDGVIHGQVRGSGLYWDYVARPLMEQPTPPRK